MVRISLSGEIACDNYHYHRLFKTQSCAGAHNRCTMGLSTPGANLPDKPTWYGHLDEIITRLKALPYPWVDRATLQQLLGVGRRRAQQILQPCVTHQVGANGVADRERLIAHIEQIAAGQTAVYEHRRRQKLAETLEKLHQQAVDNPRLLVEAPIEVVNITLAGLPEGISIGNGEIRVKLDDPQKALERLLALAMAIGNDFEAFEKIALPNP